MSNRLLRQYGVAAQSSLTPVIHPEDVQPNEMGRRGTQRAPPNIAVTTTLRGGSKGIRGGYRGPYRGGPFTQFAVRGNSSWRDRGRGRGSSRGGPFSHNVDHNRYPNSPAAHSSPFKQQPSAQWGRQESTAVWKSSLSSTSGSSTSTVISVGSTSSCHSIRNSAAKTDAQFDMHQNPRNASMIHHPGPTPKPASDFLSRRRDDISQPDRSRPVKRSLSPAPMKAEKNYSHTPNSSSTTVKRSLSPAPMNPLQNYSHIPNSSSTTIEPISPLYQPTSPPYQPTSPPYQITSPPYQPMSPPYQPTSPPYQPMSPPYQITSPPYEPISPSYEPTPPPPPLYQPIPYWCIRSRSPSPLLPPTPLKRRKIAHDRLPSNLSTTEIIDTTLKEIQYSLITDSELASRIILGDPDDVPLPETGRQTPQKPIICAPARPARELLLTPPESRTTVKREPSPVKIKAEDRSPRKLSSAPAKSTAKVTVERALSSVRVKSENQRSVKQEPQSPHPADSSQPVRKLITEATKYYPIPDKCKKSNPDFVSNRRSYFVEKVRELRQIGLKKTKAFWREDGLVIEWSSSMPVWSDTLKPEIPDLATAIKRANEINSMCMPKSPKAKKIKSVSTAAPTASKPGPKTDSMACSSGVEGPTATRDDNSWVAIDNAQRRLPSNTKETNSAPLHQNATSKPADTLLNSIVKRKAIDDDDVDPVIIEVIDDVESVRKRGEPARKKMRKHWNAEIPTNEPHLSDNAASITSTQLPVKRPPLPTRLHRPAQPGPASADPTPFTVPDPAAALPSQEWKTASNKADNASRLMFKPSHPRKSQGGTETASETASTATRDRTSASRDYMSNDATIARGSRRDDLPPSERSDRHSMSSASSQVSTPSANAKQRSDSPRSRKLLSAADRGMQVAGRIPR